MKWGLVLVPGKQLKSYLQGKFEYHLFRHLAFCFSNMSGVVSQLKPSAASLAPMESFSFLNWDSPKQG